MKKLLIILGCIILLTLGASFIIPGSQSPSIEASNGIVSFNNGDYVVTARAYGVRNSVVTEALGYDMDFGGWLEVGLSRTNLIMDNDDTYIIDSLEDYLILGVRPSSHFTFHSFLINGTYRITSQFYQFSLSTIDTEQIEISVFFEFRSYTVDLNAVLFQPRGGSRDIAPFNSNQQAFVDNAPTVVSLGDEVTFRFNQVPGFRFAFPEVERVGGRAHFNMGHMNRNGGQVEGGGNSWDGTFRYDGNENSFQFSYEFTFTANMLFLNDFVQGGALNIFAVYVRTRDVTLQVGDSIDVADVLDYVSVTVRSFVPYATYDRSQADQGIFTIDEGSMFRIGIMNDPYHLYFSGFSVVGNSALDTTSSVLQISSIQGDTTVNIGFARRTFNIVINGIPGHNEVVRLDGAPNNLAHAVVNSSNTPVTSIRTFDVLNGIVITPRISIEDIRGVMNTYVVQSVRIHGIANEISIDNQSITTEFLNNHLFNNEDIIILVYLARLAELRIDFPETYRARGTVEIFRTDGGGNVVGDAFSLDSIPSFEIGEGLRIVVTFNRDIFNFNWFGLFDGETPVISGAAVRVETLDFDLNFTRSLRFQFTPIGLALASNDNNRITFDRETYDLGNNNTVSITYNLPNNHRIRRWTINGYNYRSLGSNVVRSGNTITINLTEAFLTANPSFLANGNLSIENNVDTGFNPGIIIAITVPGVLIILMAAMVVLFLIINNRRKM